MQYSLRALLVTMTLAAIGLAAWQAWAEYQERQLTTLVERFNAAFEVRDFEKADRIAKRAAELYPESPTTEQMDWKARFALRLVKQFRERETDEERKRGPRCILGL